MVFMLLSITNHDDVRGKAGQRVLDRGAEGLEQGAQNVIARPVEVRPLTGIGEVVRHVVMRCAEEAGRSEYIGVAWVAKLTGKGKVSAVGQAALDRPSLRRQRLPLRRTGDSGTSKDVNFISVSPHLWWGKH